MTKWKVVLINLICSNTQTKAFTNIVCSKSTTTVDFSDSSSYLAHTMNSANYSVDLEELNCMILWASVSSVAQLDELAVVLQVIL